MNFNLLGQIKRYIQVGTVATDQDYRNKGLSRFLMEKIFQEWDKKCDLIYLFANKTVLEMYPKFGFEKVKEYENFKKIEHIRDSFNHKKLDMSKQSDKNMLYNYAKHSAIFGTFSMQENADLVMFYCISFLKENIYYLKDLDVIAIATFDNKQLRLWDVFGKTDVELNEVINSLAPPQIKEVLLGFTPKDCSTYDVREFAGDDVLFIQKGKTKIFEENKLMFPLLSHA